MISLINKFVNKILSKLTTLSCFKEMGGDASHLHGAETGILVVLMVAMFLILVCRLALVVECLMEDVLAYLCSAPKLHK